MRHSQTKAALLAGKRFAKKIFSEQTEPLLPASGISAAEFSHFRKQGLT